MVLTTADLGDVVPKTISGKVTVGLLIWFAGGYFSSWHFRKF